jgi:hypothetical protein
VLSSALHAGAAPLAAPASRPPEDDEWAWGTGPRQAARAATRAVAPGQRAFDELPEAAPAASASASASASAAAHAAPKRRVFDGFADAA